MDLFGSATSPLRPASAEIRIPIPEGFESEDDDVDEPDLDVYFAGLLRGPFRDALDLDLEDDRAVIDNVKIESVEAHGDDICVSVVLSISAYYGCEDQNYADDDPRFVEGTRDGDDWVFAKHVSREPLAPNEEL